MGATKNIEMREFNGVDYDLLLPKTDAYTRNETLTNYTKNILNLSSDAVPDDAFIALALGQGTYGYRIKVQLKDGTPVEGANISGIQSLVGNSLITGTDGIVLGKSTNASVNISCTSPFVDQKSPNSIVVQKTGIITDYTITLINVEDMLTFPYSKSVKVSHVAKSMDITAVGRGGGGGGRLWKKSWGNAGGGGGGGGGYVSTKLSLTPPKNLTITVGGGGSGGSSGVIDGSASVSATSGGSGGMTIVVGDGIRIVEASGGSGGGYSTISDYNGRFIGGAGGYGNGIGGAGGVTEEGDNYSLLDGKNGLSGSGYIFNNSSLKIAGRGGGGGAPRLGNVSSSVYSPSYGSTGQPDSYGSRGKGCKGNNYSISADQGRGGVVYVLFHF